MMLKTFDKPRIRQLRNGWWRLRVFYVVSPHFHNLYMSSSAEAALNMYVRDLRDFCAKGYILPEAIYKTFRV